MIGLTSTVTNVHGMVSTTAYRESLSTIDASSLVCTKRSQRFTRPYATERLAQKGKRTVGALFVGLAKVNPEPSRQVLWCVRCQRLVHLARVFRRQGGARRFLHQYIFLGLSTSLRKYFDFMDVGEVLSEAKHPLARSIAG